MFKALATQLSIALFLSHDIGNREAQEVSELMSAHWRGMISVPVSIRAPWAWWKSGYSKAITAKVCGKALLYRLHFFVIVIHTCILHRRD